MKCALDIALSTSTNMFDFFRLSTFRLVTQEQESKQHGSCSHESQLLKSEEYFNFPEDFFHQRNCGRNLKIEAAD